MLIFAAVSVEGQEMLIEAASASVCPARGAGSPGVSGQNWQAYTYLRPLWPAETSYMVFAFIDGSRPAN